MYHAKTHAYNMNDTMQHIFAIQMKIDQTMLVGNCAAPQAQSSLSAMKCYGYISHDFRMG
jgi:hypothetical protein